MAVLDVAENGLTLRETAGNVTIDEIVAATDAELVIDERLLATY